MATARCTKRPRPVLSLAAPEGWQSMYAADVDDWQLMRIGSLYNDTLYGLLAGLKALGLRHDADGVLGEIAGRRVIVAIWWHGAIVSPVLTLAMWNSI
jgi:hypothetical protein